MELQDLRQPPTGDQVAEGLVLRWVDGSYGSLAFGANPVADFWDGDTSEGIHAEPAQRRLYAAALDELLARQDELGMVEFDLVDAALSVRLAVEGDGTVRGSAGYDGFGSSTNPGVAGGLGFTARRYDAQTGLYYLRARYYDPVTGRFVSQDPALFLGGDANLQRYVNNSPVSLRDPTGMGFWGAVGGFIGGALGGAVAGCLSGAISGGLAGCVGGAAVGALAGAVTGAVAGADKADVLSGMANGAVTGIAVGGFMGAFPQIGAAMLGSVGIGVSIAAPTSPFVPVVIGCISSAGGEAASHAIEGKPISVAELALQCLSGSLLAGIGYKVGKLAELGDREAPLAGLLLAVDVYLVQLDVHEAAKLL
jgi:RHS repeat-associated protein